MPVRPFRSRLTIAALAWLTLAAVTAAAVGAYNYARLKADFDAEARTLHRIISQRADQHDAHLTSLAAIVSSSEHSALALRAVADALLRFYPRITAIDVIAFEPAPQVTFTTNGAGQSPRDADAVARMARVLQPGQTALGPGASAGEFSLVKRVPAGAVAMNIDGMRLSETDGTLHPGTALVLTGPSNQQIARFGPSSPSGTAVPMFRFEKELGSRSQPLALTVVRQPSLPEVLPGLAVVLILLGAGFAVFLGDFVLRERRTAREARQRAQFHAHDARLAHAMRVNTVGEMASGIAHELTQPLTAILSQSQAGLRLARSATAPAEILGVLEANVRLAKRAGDILARLRAYISNKTPVPEPTGLNLLVRNVVELARTDLEQRGVTLDLELSPDEPRTLIDRVSIEQVVHNLLRNAVDAVEALPVDRKTVRITTGSGGSDTFITVRDHGSGVSPENLPRLFEPFFTTKDGGMGLGLPLCERLVEGFGGHVTAANDPDGGAVFTVRLPAMA